MSKPAKLLFILLLLQAVVSATGFAQLEDSVEDLKRRWTHISMLQTAHERSWETNIVIERLFQHKDDKATDALRALYEDAPNLEIRAHILRCLGLRGGEKHILFVAEELSEIASSDDIGVFALREIVTRCQDAATLLVLADQADDVISGRAMESVMPMLMARMPRRDSEVEDLRALLPRFDAEVSGLAAIALARWGDEKALSEVGKLSKGKVFQRMCAADALGPNMKESKYAKQLHKLTTDRYWQARLKACLNIVKYGQKADLMKLCDTLGKEERLRVQMDASKAMQELTKKNFGIQWKAWKYWFSRQEDGEWKDARDSGTAEYFGYQITSGHIVFVIDVSGSMQARYTMRTRLDHAKEELIKVLNTLNDGVMFNIIAFNHEVKTMYDGGLIKANKKIRKVATRWVENLQSEGGTNTYGALAKALNTTKADTVYFLSDGMPSFGDYLYPFRIRMKVASWNRQSMVQIHCIGLLSGMHFSEKAQHLDGAEEFLRDLAKSNSGECVIIREN